MFTLERQNAIMALIKAKKTVSVHELSGRFFTSEASIRRDLTSLEKQGDDQVLVDFVNNVEIPVNVREQEQMDTKTQIAKIAATLIQNQDTIFLDSSTTTGQLTKFLQDKDNLTVVTNGIRAIIGLAELPDISIYSIGGKLRNHSLSVVGGQAESFSENFWATKLFFSCTGLLETLGAMDYSSEEAEVRKKIMKNCQTKILLADHTKFGRPAFYKICGFDRINILITDQKPADHWMEILEKHNIRLLYP